MARLADNRFGIQWHEWASFCVAPKFSPLFSFDRPNSTVGPSGAGGSTMREGRLMLLRLKQFRTIQSDKVELLGRMMIEFKKMAAYLAEQVAAEEERTGNKDIEHFAYSTTAKAAALRRRNLMNSVSDIKSRLDLAKRELDAMTIQLRALELLERPTRRSTHSLEAVEKHIT
jgi:flagellar protein FliJ